MLEQMFTEIINFWGFEHMYTIEFANAMNILTIAELQELFDNIMNRDIFTED